MTVDVVGDRELGVASRPRPIGTDLELIRLIPLDQLDVDEHGFAVIGHARQVLHCDGPLARGEQP